MQKYTESFISDNHSGRAYVKMIVYFEYPHKKDS